MGSVKDTDHGYLALIKRLTGARGLVLTVGVHGPEGAAEEPGSGKTVAEIATIHEFGGTNSRPPQRSFIRAWADENQTANRAALRAVALNVFLKGGDPKVALDRLGLLFVGGIQTRMSKGIPPPNAESTIAQKGSSKPLIDTGQLRSSIRHKVSSEGDE